MVHGVRPACGSGPIAVAQWCFAFMDVRLHGEGNQHRALESFHISPWVIAVDAGFAQHAITKAVLGFLCDCFKDDALDRFLDVWTPETRRGIVI